MRYDYQETFFALVISNVTNEYLIEDPNYKVGLYGMFTSRHDKDPSDFPGGRPGDTLNGTNLIRCATPFSSKKEAQAIVEKHGAVGVSWDLVEVSVKIKETK